MFFPNAASYVNFPLVVAYVKEIVQRKTVEGGGHEFGITIEEISDEIRFIFSAQFGSCPISILDISNALNQIDENGEKIFDFFVNFEGKTLWRVSHGIEKRGQKRYYFEPIRSNPQNQANLKKNEDLISSVSFISKQKEKTTPSATIDLSLMLKDEHELEEEIVKLKKRKSVIEKENTKMRVAHRLLLNPQLLNKTIEQMEVDRCNITDAYEQLSFHASDVMNEIDSIINQ